MKAFRVAQVLVIIGLMILIDRVAAVPSGVGTITPISSGRMTIDGGSNVSAVAGNVSEIILNGNSITQTWQGYFGNVSGKIVLGDINNNTFYDWSAASAHGEVYATRSATTPIWANIKCANISDVSSEDAYLGTNQSTDVDSVNNTFVNTTGFPSFYVGSVLINNSKGCPGTMMYNASGVKSTTNFAEVLLSDTSNMIYTSVLEQKAVGFDNRPHDFEMLVGENGHGGDMNPTTYFFYLELG